MFTARAVCEVTSTRVAALCTGCSLQKYVMSNDSQQLCMKLDNQLLW